MIWAGLGNGLVSSGNSRQRLFYLLVHEPGNVTIVLAGKPVEPR